VRARASPALARLAFSAIDKKEADRGPLGGRDPLLFQTHVARCAARGAPAGVYSKKFPPAATALAQPLPCFQLQRTNKEAGQ
jgi:hypothetical protein